MNVLRKANALFTAWLAHMTIYRAEIVIWMLVGTLPLVMMAVWIGKAEAAGGVLQGFNRQSFAAYFLASWLAQQFTVAWVAWELSFEIRQGNLSPKLLLPLNPFWVHLMRHITERVIRMPFVIALVVIAAFVSGASIDVHLGQVLLFLLSSSLAFLLRFFISYCIGVASFWFENATSVDELYWTLLVMLGGSFAPLEFYPAWLRSFIDLTPFPWLVYYPVKILTGAIVWPNAWRILLTQCLWVLIFAGLQQMMWRSGIKKYGAVGA